MSKLIPKKIAVIGIRGYPAGFPGSGGIDSYFQAMLPKLVKKGISINIFVRSWVNNPKINDYHNLKVIKIPTFNHKYLDTPIYSFFATILSCISNVDLVWYHAPGSALFCFLPKFFGKRVYLTLHGIDWQREKWGFFARTVLRLAEFISITVACKIFVVSRDLKTYVKNRYDKQSILATPELIYEKKIRPELITEKFNLKGNQYLLYLGRFVPEKRIDWIIKAFLKSDKLKNKFKLVLAGEVKNDKYCQALKKLSNHSNNIIFTDYVSGKTKQELLSNCRLFILPSSLEGYSIALGEALGYQKNCLVSDLEVNRRLSKIHPIIHTFSNVSFSDFSDKISQLLF
jgi:glycosyltransferase involved in cell wall biosynthesis